jgi:hypothetical protein
MTPDDSCFYREPDAILTHRSKTEHFVGRLPRRVAYPLILLVSIVLWTPAAIAAVRMAEWIAAWLR